MLSSPDADLCHRDPALPGLRLLLDPEELKAKLNALGCRLPFDSFAPAYLRYKPETNCLVGFTADGNSQISFYGKVFPHGTRKLRVREASLPAAGKRFTLDDEAIELVFFPADNKLALASISDHDSLSRICGAVANTSPALIPPLTSSVLAYRPERRCVVSINAGTRRLAVVKAYARGEFAASAGRAIALRAASNVPSLTSVNESDRLLAFPWVKGKLLQQRIEDGTVTRTDLLATGAALADLHRQQVPSLSMRGVDSESERLLDIAAMVDRLSPDLGALAQTLVTEILDRLNGISEGEATLHGDFGAKQVVIRDGMAALIDLDEAGRGNAAIDLGNFVARMEADALRGGIRPDGIAASRSTLLAGYASTRAVPADRDISFATALGLFRVAHEPFRRHLPDWPSRIRVLLHRVEAILDGSRIDQAGHAYAGSTVS